MIAHKRVSLFLKDDVGVV